MTYLLSISTPSSHKVVAEFETAEAAIAAIVGDKYVEEDIDNAGCFDAIQFSTGTIYTIEPKGRRAAL